ncbi:MAG: hypothetical protein IKW38_00235 [Kiritimatiellae bacterium]|nr:hypothetical protein [Kiritimatiellia bacterium]
MDKFKALIAEFNDFCERYKRCAACPYHEYEDDYECTARFVFDKLTMGTPPAVEEKVEASGLPEWCKAGAWLMTGVCPGVFFRVDDADEEFTVLVHEDGFKRVEHSSCLSDDYRPVPFQMYSLQEAMKLIGQLMVVTGESAEVIHSVSLDRTTGDVLINYLPVDHYRLKRPTINGIPFGAPSISADEIVKRGARKESNPLVGKMEGVLHGQHELQALPGDASGGAPGREVLGN